MTRYSSLTPNDVWGRDKKPFKLTQATKRQIYNFVGKCENCRDTKSLEVHHIKKQSQGGGNTSSNLIVLCHNCHKNKAHRGELSATKQREKVRKRSKKTKEGIAVIIRKARGRKKKASGRNRLF